MRISLTRYFLGKSIVDGVDPWNKKPHCRKETKTRTKVNQSDLQGIKAVNITVDRLELGVKAVSGCKYEGFWTMGESAIA
jgi:hypothetical protein